MREPYKFSVIIPTMWCSNLILKLLDVLNDNHMVGEVILIDNDSSKRPPQITPTSKLRIIEQEQNIYVNPAWNLGVELSNYENICISNDDLVWDVNCLPYIKENLHLGIIGQDGKNYYGGGEYSLQKIDKRGWGWGCLLFIDKINWKPIPSTLKVAYGDDWLLREVGGWMITGIEIETEPHPWGLSRTASKNEFVNISFEDEREWNKL
jgi:hypothetical protein